MTDLFYPTAVAGTAIQAAALNPVISGLLSYIQRFQLDKRSIEKKIRKFLVLVFLGVNQSIFGILIDTDVTLYLIITLTKKRGDHYSKR